MKQFLTGAAMVLCGCLTLGGIQAQSVTLPPGAMTVQSAESLSTCVRAIAAQSDPAKLATLGQRQANPRLKRILYWLAEARAAGEDPGDIIDRAQQRNGGAGTPRALLVKASLLRNLKICEALGMVTPDKPRQVEARQRANGDVWPLRRANRRGGPDRAAG